MRASSGVSERVGPECNALDLGVLLPERCPPFLPAAANNMGACSFHSTIATQPLPACIKRGAWPFRILSS